MKNRRSAIPKWPKKNLISFTEPGFSRREPAHPRFFQCALSALLAGGFSPRFSGCKNRKKTQR